MCASDSTTPQKRCSRKENCVHPEKQGDGWLPATSGYFHSNKSKKDGFRSECKVCHCQEINDYRINNPDRVRTSKRRSTAKNKDKVIERQRRYRSKNIVRERERGRIYRAQHAEEIRERFARWAEENKDRMRENGQRWTAKNRGKVRASSKKWRLKNSQRVTIFSRNYKARKRSAEGTHTPADIAAQLKRQKGRCYYAACGHCKLNGKYHVDHVVPLTRTRPSNAPDNLVIACPSCNLKKGNKLPHEWAEGGRLL
jgi:5-methylcytosine-specific restriction endonuclease McrA